MKLLGDRVKVLAVLWCVPWGCLIAAMASLSGCGKRGPLLILVGGLVTLDGEPLPAAAVAFEEARDMNNAVGVTQDDGRFQFHVHKVGKGAMPGLHRVQICCSQSDSPGSTVDISPKRYCTFDESGLTAEVTATRPTFTFDLSSKAAAE